MHEVTIHALSMPFMKLGVDKLIKTPYIPIWNGEDSMNEDISSM
jgi:hypothetical protein